MNMKTIFGEDEKQWMVKVKMSSGEKFTEEIEIWWRWKNFGEKC